MSVPPRSGPRRREVKRGQHPRKLSTVHGPGRIARFGLDGLGRSASTGGLALQRICNLTVRATQNPQAHNQTRIERTVCL